MAVAETAPPRRARERFTVTPETYRWFAYAALGTLTLIIFSGAAVRLTGSGLGCSNWPRCEDSFVPPLETHTLIEFGNRLVTGVVGLPCILAAVGAFRRRPFRRDLVVPAVLLPLGVLAQAILGGLTVLLHLSWQVVIGHYLLSIVLLIAAVVLVWRVRRPADAARPEHPRGIVRAVRALAVYGGYVIVAGTFATAAGPHAGGAGTGDHVARLDAFGADTLRTLIHLHGHSATAMGVALVALWLYARRRGVSAQLQRALTVAALLMAAQGVLGLVQYHLALPAEIVWAHASLAAVLWSALVWAVLAAGQAAAIERSRPAALAA
ncbi:MAG TPA: COX15/CtaA family protein [Solirubrobacteraceae bacterium]|nr:COX15/CtaA family protein [Solirubrobacteraceae bacterium]